MTTLKFKTNINCKNCVRSVTPFIEEVEGIQDWSVDTNSSDKILTIKTTSIDSEVILEVVEDAGFDIQVV